MLWILPVALLSLVIVIGAVGLARGGARSNRPFTKAEIERRCRDNEGSR